MFGVGVRCRDGEAVVFLGGDEGLLPNLARPRLDEVERRRWSTPWAKEDVG
jgi:hypothetical protein